MLNNKHILLELLEMPWSAYSYNHYGRKIKDDGYSKYYQGQGVFLIFDSADKKWHVSFVNMPDTEDLYYKYTHKHKMLLFETVTSGQECVDAFLRNIYQLLVFM